MAEVNTGNTHRYTRCIGFQKQVLEAIGVILMDD